MNPSHTILVIFGITGDLAQRKLLPALRTIMHEGLVPPTKVIGISRSDADAGQLLRKTFGDTSDAAVTALTAALSIFKMDLANQQDYHRLKSELESVAAQLPGTPQIIFYLSVPPQATLPIIASLGQAGLNDKKSVKLLLEKPFGVDLASAEETVAAIAAYYDESQLYRIDHYLAKEMAQNIVAFRSHNALFRHLWTSQFIDRIDIIASEQIGIEGRAGFYEQTGALRDFVQNHLMQLMALTLMDIPPGFSARDLPNARLQALGAIDPIRPDMFARTVRRGQYAGYADEVANPGSQTETFASVILYSSAPQWKNMPIRLATGKRLAEQTTEIRVYFKQLHDTEANSLVLHMQPREGISVALWAKKPGYEKAVEQVDLHFDYRGQGARSVEAYERVLIDAFVSDKSLFASADEVLASWRILEPVQQRWAMSPDDLVCYQPGTVATDFLDGVL